MSKIGRGSPQFALRLPDGMRDEIKASAALNERSMNAEIVSRLTEVRASLRDQFAMAALTGLIASGNDAYDLTDSDTQAAYAAFRAYTVADAMLAIREKGGGE